MTSMKTMRPTMLAMGHVRTLAKRTRSAVCSGCWHDMPLQVAISRTRGEQAMAMQSIELEPLSAAQIDAAAIALAHAFRPSPMFHYLFQDTDEQERQSPALFRQLLRYARRVGTVSTTLPAPVGTVVSWPVPTDETALASASEDSLAAMPELLGQATLARFVTLIAHVDSHVAQLMPATYWYLTVLGVAPEAQGQGIGGALVRRCLGQAAEAGMPVCLWTDTEPNVRFYQGLGMSLVGDGLMPGSTVPYWILRWDAPPDSERAPATA
jgi:ribosomal protein S18 acetylase RimI-like enzyme